MESKKEEMFRYWLQFGYKLGRMEFIWGGLPETEQEFDKALNELLFMIGESFNPSLENYIDFSEQILLYYQREDVFIYSSILIGICLQRYQLSLVLSGDNQNLLKRLAKSALDGIPQSFIPDKDFLFSAITSCKDASLPKSCSRLIEAIDIMNDQETSINDTFHVVHEDNKYVFISYSTKDLDYIKTIKKQLKNKAIKYWIAPDSIPAGGEYTELIVNAIENSSAVLLVLSENSQESLWVPKELDIAISSEKIIIPIHIDKSALNKKMRFRLSNSQIAEASENFEQKLTDIISVIVRILE